MNRPYPHPWDSYYVRSEYFHQILKSCTHLIRILHIGKLDNYNCFMVPAENFFYPLIITYAAIIFTGYPVWFWAVIPEMFESCLGTAIMNEARSKFSKLAVTIRQIKYIIITWAVKRL